MSLLISLSGKNFVELNRVLTGYWQEFRGCRLRLEVLVRVEGLWLLMKDFVLVCEQALWPQPSILMDELRIWRIREWYTMRELAVSLFANWILAELKIDPILCLVSRSSHNLITSLEVFGGNLNLFKIVTFVLFSVTWIPMDSEISKQYFFSVLLIWNHVLLPMYTITVAWLIIRFFCYFPCFCYWTIYLRSYVRRVSQNFVSR